MKMLFLKVPVTIEEKNGLITASLSLKTISIMSYKSVTGGVREIKREANISSFEWTIPNFYTLVAEKGDFYSTPFFNASAEELYLIIYPIGIMPHLSGEMCDLFLIRWDSDTYKTLSVTAGIRSEEGVVNRKKIIFDNRYCCWSGFCDRSKLEERGLLINNALIITMDVMIHETGDSSTQTDEEFKESNIPTEVRQGIEKMSEDIDKLLSTGEKSDVTVEVDGTDFKVHSLVLFARCPALSVSLQHESKELATSKIVVKDCQPEIFKDFLGYLYTGCVSSLDEQNVFLLHRIADRYLVEDLRQQCFEYIWDTLSVQTFCDAVRLALTHGHKDLLKKAVEFATKNIRSIIRTVEWQIFNRDHPTEATEILIKALGPEN